MPLRARNAFPRGRATLNPLRPFHSPRPGPTLAHGIRAGSQRAAEPRKRENTTSRKRKKGQREKKTHLYTCTRFLFGGKFYGVENTATIAVQYKHPRCVHMHRSAQSKRGRRKGYYGVRLPYAVVIAPRPSFGIRAALLSSRSSNSSSNSLVEQHQ